MSLTYFFSPAVKVDTTGLSLVGGAVLAVKDTTTNVTNFLTAKANISTGAASSYAASGGAPVAVFSPGPGVEVEVDSASCVGGLLPGVCLQGSTNTTGTYVASLNSTGSFQALFKVAYVSPFITSLFSLPNTWMPVGSDSFTTSQNVFANGGTTARAKLGAGAITFQTGTVPEPGTLALMGSGILCAAGLIRRRMS